jgi:hypothetical protein
VLLLTIESGDFRSGPNRRVGRVVCSGRGFRTPRRRETCASRADLMRLETLFRFFGFLGGSLTSRRSRRALLVSGIVLGILSDAYEVACSGQLPKS